MKNLPSFFLQESLERYVFPPGVLPVPIAAGLKRGNTCKSGTAI